MPEKEKKTAWIKLKEPDQNSIVVWMRTKEVCRSWGIKRTGAIKIAGHPNGKEGRATSAWKVHLQESQKQLK